MAPTKKRSPKKSKKDLVKGVGLGIGLTALVGLAYKQGLFDKLSEKIKASKVPVQNSPVIQMDYVSPSIPEQKLNQGKIQENYMLGNISNVLRKPITEIKAEGITKAELTELRKNNIELEDIKPFVKILKN
jgi:hypothetical protein